MAPAQTVTEESTTTITESTTLTTTVTGPTDLVTGPTTTLTMTTDTVSTVTADTTTTAMGNGIGTLWFYLSLGLISLAGAVSMITGNVLARKKG
jgi:hypothetical protein